MSSSSDPCLPACVLKRDRTVRGSLAQSAELTPEQAGPQSLEISITSFSVQARTPCRQADTGSGPDASETGQDSRPNSDWGRQSFPNSACDARPPSQVGAPRQGGQGPQCPGISGHTLFSSSSCQAQPSGRQKLRNAARATAAGWTRQPEQEPAGPCASVGQSTSPGIVLLRLQPPIPGPCHDPCRARAAAGSPPSN